MSIDWYRFIQPHDQSCHDAFWELSHKGPGPGPACLTRLHDYASSPVNGDAQVNLQCFCTACEGHMEVRGRLKLLGHELARLPF